MIKRLTSFILGCAFVPAVLFAQAPQSYNTTLFGTLNPTPNSGRYSALTGYVAPDGREYALLAGFTGTHIIDVTEDPIKEVAFIPGPPSGWREMKTVGQYGYVVSEGGEGLQIIDLSQLPDAATLVGSDVTHFQRGHTISTYGNYIFVNGSNLEAQANGGTMIFDVGENPTNPKLVGIWSLRYVHDATIRNDTMYAAAINNGRLDVVYLGADKRNPVLVTSIEYPGAGTHNSDLTEDGRFIMTTDEVNSTPKTLKVWDRRDIDNITKVADYTPVPGEVIHNVHTKGRHAFVSWYTAGTRIIDMTVPTEPAEVGYFDTFEGASSAYAGNWEVYPYLPSGKILASDMQSGLFVFTFNGASRGSVHGTVRDASTGAPIPNAIIRIPELGRTIYADAQGRYNYVGAADTLAYNVVALNYVKGSGSLVLLETGNELDIMMTQMPLASFSLNAVDNSSGADIPFFAYRISERPFTDGRAANNPQSMALPKDSTYHIYVGAWGYLPKLVEVRNQEGVLTVGLERGYYDNAEIDLGWSYGQPTDNAIGGRWERGIPIMTGLGEGLVVQPGEDHTPGAGVEAFLTGITDSELGIGANDVDEGTTTLTSPVMDLTGYNDPIINAAIWYSRDVRNDAINDTLEVMISADGIKWIAMARIFESPQAWTEHSFRVRDFIGLSATTWFRIVASDLSDQSLVEAGLDDFAVIEGAPSSAPDAPIALRSIRYALRPNPFSATASLEIELPSAQHDARLELFDAFGRRAALLHEGALASGATSFAIDGRGLASGRYTWRLLLDDGSIVSGGATVVR